jgi:hypothetical protein
MLMKGEAFTYVVALEKEKAPATEAETETPDEE